MAGEIFRRAYARAKGISPAIIKDYKQKKTDTFYPEGITSLNDIINTDAYNQEYRTSKKLQTQARELQKRARQEKSQQDSDIQEKYVMEFIDNWVVQCKAKFLTDYKDETKKLHDTYKKDVQDTSLTIDEIKALTARRDAKLKISKDKYDQNVKDFDKNLENLPAIKKIPLLITEITSDLATREITSRVNNQAKKIEQIAQIQRDRFEDYEKNAKSTKKAATKTRELLTKLNTNRASEHSSHRELTFNQFRTIRTETLADPQIRKQAEDARDKAHADTKETGNIATQEIAKTGDNLDSIMDSQKNPQQRVADARTLLQTIVRDHTKALNHDITDVPTNQTNTTEITSTNATLVGKRFEHVLELQDVKDALAKLQTNPVSDDTRKTVQKAIHETISYTRAADAYDKVIYQEVTQRFIAQVKTGFKTRATAQHVLNNSNIDTEQIRHIQQTQIEVNEALDTIQHYSPLLKTGIENLRNENPQIDTRNTPTQVNERTALTTIQTHLNASNKLSLLPPEIQAHIDNMRIDTEGDITPDITEKVLNLIATIGGENTATYHEPEAFQQVIETIQKEHDAPIKKAESEYTELKTHLENLEQRFAQIDIMRKRSAKYDQRIKKAEGYKEIDNLKKEVETKKKAWTTLTQARDAALDAAHDLFPKTKVATSLHALREQTVELQNAITKRNIAKTAFHETTNELKNAEAVKKRYASKVYGEVLRLNDEIAHLYGEMGDREEEVAKREAIEKTLLEQKHDRERERDQAKINLDQKRAQNSVAINKSRNESPQLTKKIEQLQTELQTEQEQLKPEVKESVRKLEAALAEEQKKLATEFKLRTSDLQQHLTKVNDASQSALREGLPADLNEHIEYVKQELETNPDHLTPALQIRITDLKQKIGEYDDPSKPALPTSAKDYLKSLDQNLDRANLASTQQIKNIEQDLDKIIPTIRNIKRDLEETNKTLKDIKDNTKITEQTMNIASKEYDEAIKEYYEAEREHLAALQECEVFKATAKKAEIKMKELTFRRDIEAKKDAANDAIELDIKKFITDYLMQYVLVLARQQVTYDLQVKLMRKQTKRLVMADVLGGLAGGSSNTLNGVAQGQFMLANNFIRS
jgi:hypothetical protein